MNRVKEWFYPTHLYPDFTLPAFKDNFTLPPLALFYPTWKGLGLWGTLPAFADFTLPAITPDFTVPAFKVAFTLHGFRVEGTLPYPDFTLHLFKADFTLLVFKDDFTLPPLA